MSVGFAQFHPNLVVGGTYSGQVALWDNRSHRRTPVQRTPLSTAAHSVRTHYYNIVHFTSAKYQTTFQGPGWFYNLQNNLAGLCGSV